MLTPKKAIFDKYSLIFICTLQEIKLPYMKIKLSSIMVDNQDKALKFYTEILGFVKKTEIPMGEHKWLTVVSKTKSDFLAR